VIRGGKFDLGSFVEICGKAERREMMRLAEITGKKCKRKFYLCNFNTKKIPLIFLLRKCHLRAAYFDEVSPASAKRILYLELAYMNEDRLHTYNYLLQLSVQCPPVKKKKTRNLGFS
jgi:hypothetical protein